MKEHAEFAFVGKLYRYEQVSLERILTQFSIGSISRLILQCNVEHAIELGNDKLVKSLIPQWSSHPFVLNIKGGQDPIKGEWLIKAAIQGCLPLVQFLFRAVKRNTWRAFSLVYAAKNGHEHVVQWILQNMQCSEELLKYSITMAKENGQDAIVALLERGDQALVKQLGDLLLSTLEDDKGCELMTERPLLRVVFASATNSNNAPEPVQSRQKRAHARK